MTGIEAFLDVLAAAGVTHLFGNPGTTELPLNDALARDRRFQYIFGVQEIPLMAMADGFAMASGRVGVVNLHVACGLGNAMGMLYNAHIEGTPLIVTAGQQDRRLRLGEPVIEGDLVSVARPWTKWAYEVTRAADLTTALRRAIQVALAPPTGPVFLSLPVDVQLEEVAGVDLSPPSVVARGVRPAIDALDRAAELLAQARRPAILAGSRVVESDATGELTSLAERLAAPVFAEGTASHGRLPMAADHPLYRSVLPYWSDEIHAVLSEFDVLLAVGVNVLRLYIHRPPERPLPESMRLIHLDPNAWEIGKNFPVDVPVWGDPKCGLAELDTRLATRMPTAEGAVRRERIASAAIDRAAQRATIERQIADEWSAQPMTATALMGALARVLPPDGVVVEEAITTHRNLFEKLGVLRDPRGFFAHRGWALGWGLGCALGVKLAWPERPVLGLIGDGSALYGIQALWSAAHHQIPVTFVIANNVQYQILKLCGEVMGLDGLRQASCPGLEITQPAVDFVALARSLGVEAERVETPDALAEAAAASLRGDRPRLIEARIARG